MKLQQQPVDPIRDHLIEILGIGGMVLFGVIMVFLGWLKYKKRKKPAGTTLEKRPKRRVMQK